MIISPVSNIEKHTENTDYRNGCVRKILHIVFQTVAACNPYYVCYCCSLIAMLRVDVLCVGSIRASILTVLLLV